MKKLPVILAIGVAFSGAALAQKTGLNVEVYGKLYPFLMYGSNGTASVGTMQTGNSNIGFRGERDLGGGLKAGGQLEAGAYFDEGGDGTFNFDRNSFVFVSGGFGEVKLGSFDTVYKENGDELGVLGVSSGTPMSSSGVLRKTGLSGTSSFHLRQKNSVRYTTPTVGGLSAAVQYSGTLTSGVVDTVSTSATQPRLWSYGVAYEAGPLRVTYGGETHNDFFGLSQGTAKNSDDRADEVAMSYNFGDHKVALDFTVRKYSLSGSTTATQMKMYKQSASMISIDSRWSEKLRTAAHYAIASAGTCELVSGAPCSTTGYGGGKLTVGGAYYFDKQTYVFAIYNQVNNGSRATYSNMSSSQTSLKAVTGQNLKSTVVGVNYTF